MFSTSSLKSHLFNEAPVHPSNTATFPVPTHSYSGSLSSEHLPTCTGNTPSLTRLIVMLCPFPLEHTAHGGHGLSGVSSLSSPRCKKSVSCLCHTKISVEWSVKRFPIPESIFIDVTSGHMLSHGSYSTTSICTDLNAACILLTKADLPSLHHQSACTPHTRLFISSERKILCFWLLYSTCCDFIRLCFLNP